MSEALQQPYPCFNRLHHPELVCMLPPIELLSFSSSLLSLFLSFFTPQPINLLSFFSSPVFLSLSLLMPLQSFKFLLSLSFCIRGFKPLEATDMRCGAPEDASGNSSLARSGISGRGRIRWPRDGITKGAGL